MKKQWKQIQIFICTLLFFTCSINVYATTLEEIQAQKDEIQQQKEETQQQLNEVSGTISGLSEGQASVEEEISELDAMLIDVMTSINVLKGEITDKEAEIQVAQVEYEDALAEEAAQYEAMKIRIRFMYENDDASYVALLFASESISEMINKSDYMEKVYDSDRALLEAFQEAKELVAEKKTKLEEEKSELEVNQLSLIEEQECLDGLLAEKEAEAENYEVQIAQMQQTAAVYTAQIKKQNADIQKLEEAAAAKAAEEAAAKAEAEAAAGNSNAGNTGSGNSGSSSSNASDNIQSSSGSATGKQIAEYACKFVGNPYVYGGTSLTNGTDCSGFTQGVYKAFGYNISRTSTAQRSNGVEVSYANAEPGDIICYSGHVAIYLGNGRIVHASTPATGIKYESATYRTILTVRRIV